MLNCGRSNPSWPWCTSCFTLTKIRERSRFDMHSWQRIEPPDSRQRGLAPREESYQIDEDPLNLFQYIRTESTTVRARLVDKTAATAINFPRRASLQLFARHHTRQKAASTPKSSAATKSSTTLSTMEGADVDPDREDYIAIWLLLLFVVASYAFQIWRRQNKRESIINHRNRNV